MGGLTAQEVFMIGALPDEGALSRWVGRHIPAAAGAWVLAERVPRGWVDDAGREDALRFFRAGGDLDVGGFACGYAFAEGFEIRWEPGDGDTLRVRYVGAPVEGQGELAAWPDVLPRDVEVIDTEYRLWGRRLAGRESRPSEAARGMPFVNARIPRVLYYPASDAAEHLSLLVREYREADSGRTLLWRLAGVKEHA